MVVLKVRKRDGTVESFSADKIARSAIKAGAPDHYARKIADDVRSSPDLKEETTSADIRAFVLMRLQEQNLEWDHNWRKYEFETKHRPATGKP